MGTWWFGWWSLRRLLLTTIRPSFFPRRLVWAELWGSLVGLGRYQQARRLVTETEAAALPVGTVPAATGQPNPRQNKRALTGKTAVRTLELSQATTPIEDAAAYDALRLYLTWQGQLLGFIEIAHYGQPISRLELQTVIGQRLGPQLLAYSHAPAQTIMQSILVPLLQGQPVPTLPTTTTQPPTTVSVVVATFDRPNDLRQCLRSLTQQQTNHSVEIIVVDNHPASGQTPPIIAEFNQVRLVNEPRQGLSYARNAGIAASSGQIIVATDDDVIAPPQWLEQLVTPFIDPQVMVVAGNVLPYSLETPAQRLFEQYGGLGRGFERKVVGPKWFRSFRPQAVPTWELGATANAAFRAAIFRHPDIGPIELALGAGSPTGCSEDTYIFYKVLRAGYRIVYEPAAYVWHNHRSDENNLQKQIYNYSKGHVAYHLLTLFRDKDWRALWRLTVSLPYTHVWRVKERLMGCHDYPLSLIFTEMRGHLAGPGALLRSLWRVRKLTQHSRNSIYDEPVQTESQPTKISTP
jgi:O-antigen biosynthesis protein